MMALNTRAQPKPCKGRRSRRANEEPLPNIYNRAERELRANLNAIPRPNITDYPTETWSEGYQRVTWYLLQRMAGKEHWELVSNLDTPGSMIVTDQDYRQLINVLQPIFEDHRDPESSHGYNLEEVGKILAESILHTTESALSSDLNMWEKGQPLFMDLPDSRRKCTENGTCLLYAGTPYARFANGNIGNHLPRLLNHILTHMVHPLSITAKSNFFRVNNDCPQKYTVYTQPVTVRDLNPSLHDFFITLDAQLGYRSMTSTVLCLDTIIENRGVLDAANAQKLYIVSVPVANYLFRSVPELFETAFGTSSGWKRMSELDRARLVTIQTFCALKLFTQDTPNPEAARQCYGYPLSRLRLTLDSLHPTEKELAQLQDDFVKAQMDIIGGYSKGKILSLNDYLRQDLALNTYRNGNTNTESVPEQEREAYQALVPSTPPSPPLSPLPPRANLLNRRARVRTLSQPLVQVAPRPNLTNRATRVRALSYPPNQRPRRRQNRKAQRTRRRRS